MCFKAGLCGRGQKVTGKKPVIGSAIAPAKNLVIIGTVDQSGFIKQLITEKKLNLSGLKGKWEGYKICSVKDPVKGINQALVIVGSDRRGTAFGVFELSKQLGVSPWYWWADVPVQQQQEIFINSKTVLLDAPKVKYRGIFINDEAPALSNWSKEKFGGFNSAFYAKVFELMLRLKSNYIWPAMWGNAFYDDDSLNRKTADEYAIVIGTSHHEPLMRAHDEWRRYGKGKWNYDSNKVQLTDFWTKGMLRASNEKIVSVGMRGDGDEPMSRETATALLESIVTDQRKIIEYVTGKPASQTPQLWALYKEVQDYYDKGMRVPDDVTLLLCDDNWGNLRKLPKITDKPRKGGYGIYYHFDYVGGPRNYKWINTNPLPRIWEQMHLAYEHNVKDIWIVNVGDIKPMELPISFFLDYAWNPDAIGANDVATYTQNWAGAQFGQSFSKEIAEILSKYAKYNGRKKPEMLNENTYHIDHYNEANRVTKDYNDLLEKAESINSKLSPKYRDAFFQLVLHPVSASANLQNLYTAVAWNKKFAGQNLLLANEHADKAKAFYLQDSMITLAYHQLNNGKWNHMMSQTHIGYTSWQQPALNKMPTVQYVPTDAAVTEQGRITATIPSAKNKIPIGTKGNVFYETDGYVSAEANHFTKAISGKNISWQLLPDHGRTGSAITPFPVTATAQQPGGASPHLQYEFYTYSQGQFEVDSYFSPTLNFHSTPQGLQYAISIDDEAPQIISINNDDKATEGGINYKWVADNIIIKKSIHSISTPGKHTLKYWM
ncbi:MAG: glycosyhydrolase, partial [Chitinophagaceae bacterium]